MNDMKKKTKEDLKFLWDSFGEWYATKKEIKSFYTILKAYMEDYKFEDDSINIEELLAYEFLEAESVLLNLHNSLFVAMRKWKDARMDELKDKLIIDSNYGFFDINKPIIIAGFPGVGKSTAAEKIDVNYGENVCIDLESSDFHWIINTSGEKCLHPEWPMNYIKAIKMLYYETSGVKDYENLKFICISTHKEVLQLLSDLEVEFCIVRPLEKEVAINRYIERGSSKSFIESLNNNWDNYMKDLESYDMPIIISNEYLSNILKDNRLVRFIGNRKIADDRRKALIELNFPEV